MQARGIRRSPNVAPDIQIGQGDDAVGGSNVDTPGNWSHASVSLPFCGYFLLTQMQMDLFRYLLSNRIIFVAGYINDKVGNSATSCTALPFPRCPAACGTAMPHLYAIPERRWPPKSWVR